ncbi:MAG: hypothetical protein IJY71_00480 [Clostridia bacterium]|nr:hypothetical protein [Clostridia bacterium]
MYVIADIEWVENRVMRRSIVQISAVRADSEWNEVEQYTSYIQPLDETFHLWGHVAYMGGKAAEFLCARPCRTVLQEFNEWVGEDTLCWWFAPSQRVYEEANRAILYTDVQKKSLILSKYVAGFLDCQSIEKTNPYRLAKEKNISVPTVAHCARNDVIAILNLFKGIAFPQFLLLSSPPKPTKTSTPQASFTYQYDNENGLLHKRGCPLVPDGVELSYYSSLSYAIRKGYRACPCAQRDMRLAKRIRVIDEISRTQYTYIHTETGSVFHRHDCRLAHSANHIMGAIKYETVIAKGLRPCKVCRPSPNDQYRILPTKKKSQKEPASSITIWGVKREEQTALKRLQEAQRERYSGILNTNMTEQERRDLYTFTHPGYGFFAAKGYQNFHLRNCPRLRGVSDIKGFDTFLHAKRAGYTPCRYCRPTQKQSVTLSIPITSKIRREESVEDLTAFCEQCRYPYQYAEGKLWLETPVGKWIVHTEERPVTLAHVNLVRTPQGEDYHKQPRVFLSMLDALYYIHRHDTSLQAGKGDVV